LTSIAEEKKTSKNSGKKISKIKYKMQDMKEKQLSFSKKKKKKSLEQRMNKKYYK
jgi:hypothetical protein